jgi:hypothetical protein
LRRSISAVGGGLFEMLDIQEVIDEREDDTDISSESVDSEWRTESRM